MPNIRDGECNSLDIRGKFDFTYSITLSLLLRIGNGP